MVRSDGSRPAVELEKGDTLFFCDEAEYFDEGHRLIAIGSVTFRQGRSQISADRAEFDTEKRTGIFFNARGWATISDDPKPSPLGAQEAEVRFFGRTVEKIGPDKYRVTDGGFTTCLQPEPRWQITSGSVVLRLEHYALAKNSVVRVKGVPLFYLPILYYPVKKEDRATGFLMPSYGSSNLQGTKLSNAFFWAINRSQDLTVLHDWFSKTGQGVGSEYRYVFGPGSDGFASLYSLNEHEYTYRDGQGQVTTRLPRRSYTIRGTATQPIGARFRGAARVNYFSDVTVQQTYHTNIYDMSNRQRDINASVTGSVAGYSINGVFDRREYFYGTTTSLSGGTPRINVNRGDRPIPGTPIYFSVGGEFVRLLRETRTGTDVTKTGLSRFHINPTVRVPFTRWPFLTFTTSVSFPNTFYTDSQNELRQRLPDGIARRYVDLRGQVIGPTFNRVFSTPNSTYAEKLKHSIEPYLTFQRVTNIDNANRIVRIESLDYIVGGVTSFSYGVNNRLYAKRKAAADAPSSPREILSVSLRQSYYTDANAAAYATAYGSFGLATSNKFTPVRLDVRAFPTEGVNATMYAEIDSKHKAVRTIGANGGVSRGPLQATAGWSQVRFIEGLPGFDDRRFLRHVLNGSTSVQLAQNRYGGTFWFTYDFQKRETAGILRRNGFIDRRFVAYYNMQCCGFIVEYQSMTYGGLYPQNNRFNVSFTLAGLGTFSDFFGAFGGGQGRRY
jgi:hypothetical protein